MCKFSFLTPEALHLSQKLSDCPDEILQEADLHRVQYRPGLRDSPRGRSGRPLLHLGWWECYVGEEGGNVKRFRDRRATLRYTNTTFRPFGCFSFQILDIQYIYISSTYFIISFIMRLEDKYWEVRRCISLVSTSVAVLVKPRDPQTVSPSNVTVRWQADSSCQCSEWLSSSRSRSLDEVQMSHNVWWLHK